MKSITFFFFAAALAVSSASAQLTCPGTDDAFENNDTCGAARTISTGFYPSLYAEVGDPDFYRVTLQNMETLRVTLNSPSSPQLNLSRFHAACFLEESYTGNSFSYSNVNITGVPITVNFRVRVVAGGSATCTNYDMEVAVDPPPSCSVPDYLETGTTCASAAPLGDGYYPDLNVTYVSNPDFYLVSIEPGRTLEAQVQHNPGVGNLNAYLWDPSVACGTSSAGYFGPHVASASTSQPLERLTYTNTTNLVQDFVLEVVHTGIGSCNEYDLTITGLSGDPISSYCSAQVNSTGLPASIAATGSSFVNLNELQLVANQLPLFSFGYFLVSDTQGLVANPGGSAGDLCLGGSIGRFVQQTMNSGATGSIQAAVDASALPGPTGSVAVTAGETWNFQAWFRDTSPAGPTSNFSDGLQVLFL